MAGLTVAFSLDMGGWVAAGLLALVLGGGCLWFLSAMGLCAAVCALLPAPAEDSNAVYRVVYKILNWIGCNVKKAANADDTAQKKA